VPVIRKKGLEDEAYGWWHKDERKVEIDSSAVIETQAATLCHEVVEMALWDTGLHNMLDDKLKEAVCDAIGGYLGGAMSAGYLRFVTPRTNDK
jgi:hypothetical protein